MDAGTRQKRVEALEAIKDRALGMAEKNTDPFEVRNFCDFSQKRTGI
jgi:hypothetical protein